MNTKEHIIQTFSNLVSQYGYGKVNTTLIIQKANVGRTTFYRYFKDKEDVLEAHYRKLYDEAIQGCTNFRDLAERILAQAKFNSFETTMYSTLLQTPYREFVYKCMYTRGKAIIEKVWKRKLCESEDFHISFFCAGASRIIEEYAQGKKYSHMSPKEAADEILKLANPKYFVTFNENHIC